MLRSQHSITLQPVPLLLSILRRGDEQIAWSIAEIAFHATRKRHNLVHGKQTSLPQGKRMIFPHLVTEFMKSSVRDIRDMSRRMPCLTMADVFVVHHRHALACLFKK